MAAGKRLLLVLPRNDRGFWGQVRNGKTGFVRLTLPTLAALTPPDWQVEIHDARVRPVDYGQAVDLVGITAFTAEIPSAYAIADGFRRRGVPVVLGGVHVSALPEEALEHADAVVIGEAEGVWGRLLHNLEAGELQRTYHQEGYCDLSAMKLPRRDLLDRGMYVACFNTVQATRGCPYDCEFCAVAAVFGRRFRKRPVAEVVNEIQLFDSDDFFFVDDNICGDPAYAKELFTALVPLRREWGAQTSITFARDAELLELYARGGGRYAYIGFESLSSKSLNRLNKGWNRPEEFGEAVARIHAAGINILGSFIVGLDEDGPSVFEEILDFIMRHRVDAAQFHILTPFPGTRLFENLESQGRLLHRDWAKYHTGEVVFQPKRMTVQEVEDGFYRMFRQAYTIRRVVKRVFRSRSGIPFRLGMNVSYRRKAMRMPKR